LILPEEKIYRYMRHIIMPEISGPGQKKLLESCVAIFACSARDTASMMYYLVSSGIGHIKYCFDDNEGMEQVIESLQDLNPDVLIEKAESVRKTAKVQDTCENPEESLSCRIVFGDSVAKRMMDSLKVESVGRIDLADKDYIPTIFVISKNWCGAIQSVRNLESLSSIFELFNRPIFNPTEKSQRAEIFSCCFAGVLAAVESIKLCLDLGNVSEKPLYFDLLTMDFQRFNNNDGIISDAPSHLPAEKMTEGIHKKISDAKVLIVGTGGLGSPAAYALALAGVGTIGLVDSDSVEISNLNRQILHSTSRIGIPKVKSAEFFLKKLNPDVNIVTYQTLFKKSNAMEIIKDYDVVIDGVDNLPTRYLLNDACFFAGKPLAEAGVLRFDGLGMTIVPGKSHCYRCIFSEIPPAGSIPSCSEAGILGPVPGVMGFIQAAEAFKLLTGIGNTLQNRLIMFDALDLDFRITDVKQDINCPLCGENPSIKELSEYETPCNDTPDF